MTEILNGCYYRYYEFEVVTPGFMKVGWAKTEADSGIELGLDGHSYVFDGHMVSSLIALLTLYNIHKETLNP